MSELLNTILCVKWGDKYDDDYVIHLKSQIDQNLSLPYNFYCLTDKPKYEFDIQLPTDWDDMYNPDTNMFWAYRKCYMFNEKLFPQMKGERFLYLDLDILIHSELDYFFDLGMDKPYIVRGWWNDIENCRKNFGKVKSTPLNSSVIRWNRSQMKRVWEHIEKNKEVIFFSYPTIDNYFNHHWYNVWDERTSFFRGFPQGDVYSWYKGNIYPNDMELKVLRKDHKVCLFNNSSAKENQNESMFEIKELRIW